jgi:hypothetical protein
VTRKEGTLETSVVCGREGGEVFEGGEEVRVVRVVPVVARGFGDLEGGRCGSVCLRFSKAKDVLTQTFKLRPLRSKNKDRRLARSSEQVQG